jgi:hypothetical protein
MSGVASAPVGMKVTSTPCAVFCATTETKPRRVRALAAVGETSTPNIPGGGRGVSRFEPHQVEAALRFDREVASGYWRMNRAGRGDAGLGRRASHVGEIATARRASSPSGYWAGRSGTTARVVARARKVERGSIARCISGSSEPAGTLEELSYDSIRLVPQRAARRFVPRPPARAPSSDCRARSGCIRLRCSRSSCPPSSHRRSRAPGSRARRPRGPDR